MMKLSDIRTATALIIQGALRAAEDGTSGAKTIVLSETLSAIMAECEDWAENLDSANAEINVFIAGPHTPYNIAAAIVGLQTELNDLVGEDDASNWLRNVQNRLRANNDPHDWPSLTARV